MWKRKAAVLCPHRIAYKFDGGRRIAGREDFWPTLSCWLQLDNAAADRNGYRFRAIACAELLHNVTDMALHGIF